jgi:uncharacterized protein (DUF2164 family)
MILARKELETVLDSVGLNELHFDMNASNIAVLSSDCGKNLILFHGLHLKNKLTKKEREYVVQKLSNYVIENQEIILKIFKAYKELSNLKMPFEDKLKYCCNAVEWETADENICFKYTKREISVAIDDVTKERIMSAFNKFDIAKSMFEDYQDYLDKESELNEIIREGSNCTI